MPSSHTARRLIRQRQHTQRGFPTLNPTLDTEILVLTWNRLAYTQTMLRCLKHNTNWDLVSRLVVYDDGSTDGTAEWAQEYCATIGVPAFDFREIHFGAPAATMNDFLATCEAPKFVKLDNDIAVPPGWLDVLEDVMLRHPDVELLGMEFGQTRPGPPDEGEVYGASRCRHIGGVGMMRTGVFHTLPSIMSRGRSGFTEWQHRWSPHRAWLNPDLPVVHLDRMRHTPELEALAQTYVANGWMRDWHGYDPVLPHWDWLEEVCS
jgi:glycosyltransferase involved in cell wall biosynthesis